MILHIRHWWLSIMDGLYCLLHKINSFRNRPYVLCSFGYALFSFVFALFSFGYALFSFGSFYLVMHSLHSFMCSFHLVMGSFHLIMRSFHPVIPSCVMFSFHSVMHSFFWSCAFLISLYDVILCFINTCYVGINAVMLFFLCCLIVTVVCWI